LGVIDAFWALLMLYLVFSSLKKLQNFVYYIFIIDTVEITVLLLVLYLLSTTIAEHHSNNITYSIQHQQNYISVKWKYEDGCIREVVGE
jgi:hypothetical protein